MLFLAGDATASLPGIRVLVELLASREGRPVTSGEIAPLLAPPHLLPSSGAVLESCIRVADRLQLIAKNEKGELSLGTLAKTQSDTVFLDPEQFTIFFRRVLRNESQQSMSQSEAPSDLMQGICWLLSLDPLRPMPWSFNATETEKSAVATIGLRGITKYRALRRWAQQLGYIKESNSASGSRIVTTDWSIVAAELPESGTYPARTLFDELIGRVPELPGGMLGKHIIQNPDPDEPEKSLYRCLRAVELLGRVKLSTSPDAAGPNRVAVRSGNRVHSIDLVVVQ